MDAADDTIDYDADAVLGFLSTMGNHVAKSSRMTAIGVRRRGELIAGAVFEGFNGQNIWLHVAARSAHALTRRFLALCLGYAFVTCGVQRMSAMVAASNSPCLRAARKLGFECEAALSRAAEDGGDVFVMVLWRQRCRIHV